MRTVGFIAAAGNSGTAKRRNPNVPSLSMMLARTTEPAVGASTCASGSQVWNGNIGTFTANARKNAPNSQMRRRRASRRRCVERRRRS